MSAIRRILLLVPVFVLGCQSGAKTQKAEQSTEPGAKNPNAFKKLVKTSAKPKFYSAEERLSFAFSQLKEGCELVGGTFDQRSRSCECPDLANGTPQFYTTKSTPNQLLAAVGRCYEARPLLQEENVFPTFEDMVKRGGAETFYHSVKNQYDRGLGSDYILNLKSVHKKNTAYMETVAKALDKRRPHVYFSSGFGQDAKTILHIDRDIDANASPYDPATIKSLSKVWDRYKRSKDDRTEFVYPLFARDFTNITPIMGPKVAGNKGYDFPKIPSDNPHAAQLAKVKAAVQLLTGYLNGGATSRGNFQEDVQILSEGCHLRCLATTKFTVEGTGFRYERMYLHGTVVYARLLEYEGDLIAARMSYSSQVILGNGNGISAVIINEKDTSGIIGARHVTMYDENLQFTTDFKEALSIPASGVGKGVDIDLEPVVVLDSGLDANDAETMRWLKRGPNVAQKYGDGGSLLGWWNAPKADPAGTSYAKFYDGMYTDDYNALPASENYVNHLAKHVVGFHRSVGEVGFVPFSPHWQVSRNSALYEVMAKTKARIVLVPKIMQVDGATSCPRNNTYLDPQYLFVLQTGYGGLENPTDVCLPNLRDATNRIVVASGLYGPTSVASWSDAGEQFADLSESAIGKLGMDGGKGQSFAAAKVAHIAAVIAKRHGEVLSNDLIRMAILLSVNVDFNRPNSTRTGGDFDPDSALKAAQHMADVLAGKKKLGEVTSRSDLMANIIKASGALTDDEQVRKQVARLIANGI